MNQNTVQSQLFMAFPMLVAVHQFKGEKIELLNSQLSKHVEDLESQNRATQKTTSTQGGYHTDPEFINSDNKLVTQFRQSVLVPGVQAYMQQYYNAMLSKSEAVTESQMSFKGWANIMRKGEWNAPHSHLTLHNRISAVYYIKVPKCDGEEGALQLDNPNQISMLHGSHGNIKIYPVAGDLVIFPCYQTHFSHPFSNDGERILIAADIRIKDQFDDVRNNNFNSMFIRSK